MIKISEKIFCSKCLFGHLNIEEGGRTFIVDTTQNYGNNFLSTCVHQGNIAYRVGTEQVYEMVNLVSLSDKQ